jgi:hypothetical protein
MKRSIKPKHEVADIISDYGQAYRASRKVSILETKVMNAIQRCRTSSLGGHVDQCNKCGKERNAYNSCRNRHCPKCQGLQQIKWIDKSTKDLLPVRYFHLVFTIPCELNRLALINKKELYRILFQASAQTVTMLAGQQKHLGAVPGIISVLHTWGQNLTDHPHIHMIVTGGGIAPNDKHWIYSRKKFFIPVKVLSKVFRGKFLSLLKDAYYNGRLTFKGSITALASQKGFMQLLNIVYTKEWVVYAKKPFGNAVNVIKYLGKYTHRIAISNHRILKIGDGKVSFKWKDYSDQSKQKTMTLGATEFIRRFLLHTLPSGFFKIRYYGLLASRNKKEKLMLARKLLNAPDIAINGTIQNWQGLLLTLTGFDVKQCPFCKKGQMRTIKFTGACDFY